MSEERKLLEELINDFTVAKLEIGNNAGVSRVTVSLPINYIDRVESCLETGGYAWPTVADYEKDAGFAVNEAFRIGWDMARFTLPKESDRE